jgi:heme exporter protein CcmB
MTGGVEGPDFEHVTFDGVTVDYGRRRVLSRVSFECGAGTITGLLGPNGAGKTTLLGVASTRVRPSQGEVRVITGGCAVTGADLRARVGWLGHDPGLYPELSAVENLEFFARLYGLERVDAAVGSALERAMLTGRAQDPVSTYSRGMRQRLGLERALLHQPRLVLLDEPFTGLDDISSQALVGRLADLKHRGCAVLVSTHDLDLVEPLLDAAVVLREGRVVSVLNPVANLAASVRALLATPATENLAARAATSVAHASAAADAAVASRAQEPGSGFLRRFTATMLLVARKDLHVELRSRELLLTTLFFAFTCVLVFAFAFVREGRALGDAAAGILWIAMAFAGTLALGRTFDREQAHQTLSTLLLAPVERSAIYAGKLAGLLALLALVTVLIVPLVGLLFQAPLLSSPALLAAILAAGAIGFLAVGSLFSAMLVRARSRDVLLPVLLYPMTVPVMLAGVRGTAALMEAPADLPTARMWLSILLFFDAVFLTLALWTFEPVMSE